MHDKIYSLVMFAIGCLVLNHFWHKRSDMNDKFARIKKGLKSFAQRDMLWDEVLLKKIAADTFEAYRNARSTLHSGEFDTINPAFNQQAIKHLLHPDATTEVKSGNRDRFSFDSNILQLQKQVNIRIIHALNSHHDSKDTFTACIDIIEYKRVQNRDVFDQVLDLTAMNTILGTEGEEDHFKEFWTFQRVGNKWLLLGINDEHTWERFTRMRILDEGKIVSKKKV